MKKLVPIITISLIANIAYAAGSGDHSHKHEHGMNMFSVGEPANGKVDRRVSVSMRDSMRFVFEPELSSLKNGESIEFMIRNDGNIQHEFSIGNADDQVKHAEMMRRMPDMVHQDPNTASLAPGQSAKLAWTFKGGDTVVFACNIPGHYEAGMHHDIAIAN